MRTLLLVGAAGLSVTALSTTLRAQQTTIHSGQEASATAETAPIEQTADQANAQANPDPQTTTVTTTPAGRPVITTSIPGNVTSPPSQALNKAYPVCTRTLHDNCQNPGEGGAPGKSRALGYWPGEPASEGTGRGG